MTTQTEKTIKDAHATTTAVLNDERVRSGVTVEAGVISVNEDAVNAVFAHAGVDVKQFKKEQEAMHRAALGVIELAGEKSVEAFHANKELTKAEGAFKLGHQEWKVSVDREVDVPNAFDKTAAPKKVFARTNISVKSTFGKGSIKDTKDRIASLGIKKLGN